MKEKLLEINGETVVLWFVTEDDQIIEGRLSEYKEGYYSVTSPNLDQHVFSLHEVNDVIENCIYLFW